MLGAEAISAEAGELLELFLWKGKDEIDAQIKSDPGFLDNVERELADIILFCLNFANSVEADVYRITTKKIEENESEYPVGK